MNGEHDLIFVDTNVLIYAFDPSAQEKYLHAQNLLADLWETQRTSISIQVLHELYVNITQKVPFPLSSEHALQIIDSLRAWRIHAPESADVIGAIQIQQRYQISFWDAMIIRSAAQLGCTTVWSEDLNHTQIYENVQVLNPFNG